jgi:hypothetical protein
MIPKWKICLPKKVGQTEEIETLQSLLLIGANGSGKTRLGTWIEMDSPFRNKVHRLSAQKSLAMPETTTPLAMDLAEKALLYGHQSWGVFDKGSKWNSKPATTMLSDFDKLFVYLFSDETEENAKYKAASKESEVRIVPNMTKLDLVKEVWERILPHRELVIGGLRIQTKVKNSTNQAYSPSDMSDGERVIFYLIGQCLAAPKDGIIVIDEPELHLHKSVQAPLWAEIEKLRSDCLFVYLTHDVDFAASNVSATKIWLKSFDGADWDWEQLQPTEDLPDSLLLEILGSRKPVVFVEGVQGSFDASLYSSVLPNFLVIPIGSCTQVIQTVKALKSNAQLHNLDVYGVIDRDRRLQAEITSLERSSIYVLNVAEVENLFCVKEVLEIVSNRLSRDAASDFKEVSRTLFSRLNGELEAQVSLRVSNEIKFQLNMFDDRKKGLQDLTGELHSLVGRIDVSRIYTDIHGLYSGVISSNDFDALLSLYNRKSLSSQVSTILGLASGSLPETVVRLAKGECKEEIKNALKPYFGSFQQFIL